MKPGRYIATALIPLNAPFEVKWIATGQSFDVLDVDDGLVLLGFAGIRVWKRKSYFDGRALWSYALPKEKFADIGRTIDGASTVVNRVPFDVFVRDLGSTLQLGVGHG